MKNFGLFKILAVLFFALAMFSCNKENELKPTEQSSNEIVLQKILDFKADVENPYNLKTEELLTVEDAVWIVEAALNYTYCMTLPEMPETSYTLVDSTFATVSISNGSLNYTDVVNVYNDFTDWFENVKTTFGETEMYFSLADVEIVENEIKLYAIIEYGSENQLKSTTTCQWYWGKLLGNTCGQYVGQKDAATEITSYLRSVINPNPQNQPYVYWTDIVKTAYTDNSGLFYKFSYIQIGNEPSLTETEFNLYKSSSVDAHAIAKQYGLDYINSIPAYINHEWVKCYFEGWDFVNSSIQKHRGWHYCHEWFGIAHTSIPPLDL